MRPRVRRPTCKRVAPTGDGRRAAGVWTLMGARRAGDEYAPEIAVREEQPCQGTLPAAPMHSPTRWDARASGPHSCLLGGRHSLRRQSTDRPAALAWKTAAGTIRHARSVIDRQTHMSSPVTNPRRDTRPPDISARRSQTCRPQHVVRWRHARKPTEGPHDATRFTGIRLNCALHLGSRLTWRHGGPGCQSRCGDDGACGWPRR